MNEERTGKCLRHVEHDPWAFVTHLFRKCLPNKQMSSVLSWIPREYKIIYVNRNEH